jgi:hypothetical protein
MQQRGYVENFVRKENMKLKLFIDENLILVLFLKAFERPTENIGIDT